MKHKIRILAAAILAATSSISSAQVYTIADNPTWAVTKFAGGTFDPTGSSFIMYSAGGNGAILFNPDSTDLDGFGFATETITGTFDNTLLCNSEACTDNAITLDPNNFSGSQWTVHDARVFVPGTYTFQACPAPITGTDAADGSTQCSSDSVATTHTLVVPYGKLGVHMLFDWSGNANIDVILVWDINANFTNFHSGFPGFDDTRQFSFAVNTDINGNGSPGTGMLDGPFGGHGAVFNLYAQDPADQTIADLDFTPPVITPVGGNINFEQLAGGCAGDPAYAEPGVSAFDPAGSTGIVGEPYGGDGAITPITTTGDTVDGTAALGTVSTVIYNAPADAADNPTPQATRTVTIVACGADVTPPVISAVPADSTELIGATVAAPVIGDVTIVDVDTGVGTTSVVITNGLGDVVASIDASVEDTYTITYNAEDTSPALNSSSASRTVTVSGLNLTASQGGNITRTILATGGNVTFGSPFLTGHTYDWSATDDNIDSGGGNTTATFTVDPTGITAGTYIISMTMDGTLTADQTVTVINTAPTLDTSDTDNDGDDDITEGYDDSDNDGIPDYLDASNVDTNSLQLDATDSTSGTIVTGSGSLRLGITAIAASTNGAAVSMANIASNGNGSGGAPADGADAAHQDSCIGGCFDFEVNGLETASTVDVVLRLSEAIPSQNPSTFRKYNGTAWADFVTTGSNAIASTSSSSATCPVPGDAAYTTGLTAGDNCIQLSITDGGPNDADGIANGIVKDPGGLAGILDVPIDPPTPAVGGVGATGLYMLALLGSLLGFRRFNK